MPTCSILLHGPQRRTSEGDEAIEAADGADADEAGNALTLPKARSISSDGRSVSLHIDALGEAESSQGSDSPSSAEKRVAALRAMWKSQEKEVLCTKEQDRQLTPATSERMSKVCIYVLPCMVLMLFEARSASRRLGVVGTVQGGALWGQCQWGVHCGGMPANGLQ